LETRDQYIIPEIGYVRNSCLLIITTRGYMNDLLHVSKNISHTHHREVYEIHSHTGQQIHRGEKDCSKNQDPQPTSLEWKLNSPWQLQEEIHFPRDGTYIDLNSNRTALFSARPTKMSC